MTIVEDGNETIRPKSMNWEPGASFCQKIATNFATEFADPQKSDASGCEWRDQQALKGAFRPKFR